MDPARVQEIVRQLALASPDRYDQVERLANTVASVPSVFTATAAKAAVAELVETAPPVLSGVVSAVGSFMGLDELVNATQVCKNNNTQGGRCHEGADIAGEC